MGVFSGDKTGFVRPGHIYMSDSSFDVSVANWYTINLYSSLLGMFTLRISMQSCSTMQGQIYRGSKS